MAWLIDLQAVARVVQERRKVARGALDRRCSSMMMNWVRVVPAFMHVLFSWQRGPGRRGGPSIGGIYPRRSMGHSLFLIGAAGHLLFQRFLMRRATQACESGRATPGCGRARLPGVCAWCEAPPNPIRHAQWIHRVSNRLRSWW